MYASIDVALAVDDLNPGDTEEMFLFLLHLYHIIISSGPDAKHYFWPITFDEATYTSARKIIYYVTEVAPSSGQFDSMSLPDFGIFLLSPEKWHISYNSLKNFHTGPKLKKGQDEDDNKRFTYRNFTRTLLVVMRQRGSLNDELTTKLASKGIDLPKPDNDKVLNIQKEKMGAEYKDMHLYMTYFRIAWCLFKVYMHACFLYVTSDISHTK